MDNEYVSFNILAHLLGKLLLPNSTADKYEVDTPNILAILFAVSPFFTRNILKNLPPEITLIINNISGLNFIDSGHKIIAGTGMNVYNILDELELKKLGVDAVIFSQEIIDNSPTRYHFTKGHVALMHFAHCPFKTLFNNDCAQCKFSENLVLTAQNGHQYFIKRTQISQCYFTMYASTKRERNCGNFGNVVDLRFD